MTRILVIDNYDSFTYNLHHQLARVCGRAPLVVRNDAIDLDGVLALDPDAVVISPGPGHPEVAADLGVCRDVLETMVDTPVLGVCLGFQALVTLSGGRVERTEPVHGRTSPIRHSGTGLFAGFDQEFAAIRYHSLAARLPLPRELELTAWTPDGRPMGLRHRHRPAWAVQFHPESICTEDGDRLVGNFVALVREWSGPRPIPPAWDAAVEAAARTGRPDASSATSRSAARCHRRRLSLWRDPEDVFVARYADATHAFWLDSSLTGPGLARYSFLGAERSAGLAISYDVAAHRVTLRRGESITQYDGGVLDVLADELAAVAVPVVGEVPFAGGFVGYLGYEVGADCDGRPAVLAEKRRRVRGPLPDAYWMLADRTLVFDHDRREVWAVALVVGPDGDDDALSWLDAIDRDLALVAPAAPPLPGRTADPEAPLDVRLDRDRATYLADIAACQEAIRAGESYELCLTAQAELDPVDRPLDLYRVLRRVSPAPYAAYLRLGDSAVLSSSPERFLAADADGQVTSRPMKGTIGRHPDPAVDRAQRDALAASAKDRAENLMIVDLLRNDLGRVSELDSVRVPALMTVETYTTVHQLTSTIVGRLRPGTGVIDAVRAAFPGGSMTGAPKLRSLEILDRLEPRPRGIYSGTLGYLSADGRAELDIVIRTAVCSPESTTVGIGGAITILSDPEAEFDEIVLKLQGIARALLVWRQGSRPGVHGGPARIEIRGPAQLRGPVGDPRADERV